MNQATSVEALGRFLAVHGLANEASSGSGSSRSPPGVVREGPVEATLHTRTDEGLRAVPGAEDVAGEDREVWVIEAAGV